MSFFKKFVALATLSAILGMSGRPLEAVSYVTDTGGYFRAGIGHRICQTCRRFRNYNLKGHGFAKTTCSREHKRCCSSSASRAESNGSGPNDAAGP